MPSLFISYSRQDLSIVEPIEEALLANGHTVWRDLESIRGGEQWPKVMGEAIASRDVILLVWSQHAATSHFVEFEWNTALALKKIIVPCLLDDTPLPPSLRAINAIFCKNLETALPRVLQALQQPLPARNASHAEAVINKLQTIRSTAPEQVVQAAKTLFAQQHWNVQGNVYQAAGDINVTLAPPAEKPEKKLLERWQTWLTLIGGFLAILAAVTELPEKVAKMYELVVSNPKADSTQAPAEVKLQVLEGQIVDEKGEPLPEVTVYLPDYDSTAVTNEWGKYKFAITAPVGGRVKLQARRTGYDMLNQDPRLGGQPDTFQMYKTGRRE